MAGPADAGGLLGAEHLGARHRRGPRRRRVDAPGGDRRVRAGGPAPLAVAACDGLRRAGRRRAPGGHAGPPRGARPPHRRGRRDAGSRRRCRLAVARTEAHLRQRRPARVDDRRRRPARPAGPAARTASTCWAGCSTTRPATGTCRSRRWVAANRGAPGRRSISSRSRWPRSPTPAPGRRPSTTTPAGLEASPPRRRGSSATTTAGSAMWDPEHRRRLRRPRGRRREPQPGRRVHAGRAGDAATRAPARRRRGMTASVDVDRTARARSGSGPTRPASSPGCSSPGRRASTTRTPGRRRCWPASSPWTRTRRRRPSTTSSPASTAVIATCSARSAATPTRSPTGSIPAGRSPTRDSCCSARRSRASTPSRAPRCATPASSPTPTRPACRPAACASS